LETKAMMNFTSLQQYENYLLNIVNQDSKDWLKYGKPLSEIQDNNLFYQHNCSSFSNWLYAFSNKSGVSDSKLWKCLKAFRLIKKMDLPTDSVTTNSVNGLAKIADFYELTDCDIQTISLIEKLSNKEITIRKITEMIQDISDLSDKSAANANDVSREDDIQVEIQINGDGDIVESTQKYENHEELTGLVQPENVEEINEPNIEIQDYRSKWNFKLIAISLLFAIAFISVVINPNIFQQ
jgi:hypothetical protein